MSKGLLVSKAAVLSPRNNAVVQRCSSELTAAPAMDAADSRHAKPREVFCEFDSSTAGSADVAAAIVDAAMDTAYRHAKLREVFCEFDLDGSHVVDFKELLMLGKVRRELGHKAGEWTDENNATLLAAIGADQKGDVTMDMFVTYFDSILPSTPDVFEISVQEFVACARECARRLKAANTPIGVQAEGGG